MLVHLTLRPPTTKDADAVERLAIIDSANADPFRPTADVVALMRYALKHAA